MTKKAFPRICAYSKCGRTFFDHRENVKYCSPTCRGEDKRDNFYSHLSKYPGTVNAKRMKLEARRGYCPSGYSRRGGFSRKGLLPRPPTDSREEEKH